MTLIQMRDGGSLEQVVSVEVVRSKGSGSGCILKVEPTAYLS